MTGAIFLEKIGVPKKGFPIGETPFLERATLLYAMTTSTMETRGGLVGFPDAHDLLVQIP